MFCESSTLPRNAPLNRGSSGKPDEELGTVEKVVLVVLSLVVAGGTMFLPVALLHFR